MDKNEIINSILNIYGDCLNEEILFSLISIKELSDEDIKYLFKNQDQLTDYLEPLLLKCYQSKLFIENLEFKEIDLIENITCDDIGNTLLIYILRFIKYFEILSEYFELNNINSKSRTYYYLYINSMEIGNDIKKILENIGKNNNEVFEKLEMFNLKLKNNLDINLQSLLKQIEKAKKCIDINAFESSFISYYIKKINYLTLYNPTSKIELESIINLVYDTTSDKRKLKEINDNFESYQRINKELLHQENTLAKILRKY